MDLRASSFCAGVLAGALVIAAVPVEAQQQHNNVILRTVKYRGGPTVSTDMDRAMLNASFEARSHLFSKNASRKGSKFLSQAVGMGKASFKGMARVARSPIGGLGYPLAAFSGLMAAIDYFFMEDKSPPDWYNEGEDGISGYQAYLGHITDYIYAPTRDELGQQYAQLYNANADESQACATYSHYDSSKLYFDRPCSSDFEVSYQPTTYDEEDRRLSAERAWERVRNNNKMAQIAQHLANIAAEGQRVDENGDLQDNPVANEWTELQGTIDNIEAAIQAAEDAADLNGDGVLDQSELDQAPDFDLDQLPDTPPAPQPIFEINIPTGCDLLPAVCEIRDWLLEPPTEQPEEPQWNVDIVKPEDLPDTENPLPSEGGSCPSDTITVVGHTIDVPYQPFCDLAVMVKPLVIASAWLVALFLVVRK